MAKLSTLILAVPLAFGTMAVPAAAQEEARSVVVRYDDLNLSSAGDRTRLASRVKHAVEKVCDSRPNYRPSLAEQARAAECEQRAMDDVGGKLASLIEGSGTQLAGTRGVSVSAR